MEGGYRKVASFAFVLSVIGAVSCPFIVNFADELIVNKNLYRGFY